jgi:hypothetical protein
VPTLQIIYFIVMTGCVASVSKFGQREEWTALLGAAAASILSPIVQQNEFKSTEFGIMAVDLALLVWLTAISLRSDRYWPLFAAGFHLAGCSVHFAPMVGARFSGLAYGYAAIGSAYFVLTAIAIGALLEARPQAPAR